MILIVLFHIMIFEKEKKNTFLADISPTERGVAKTIKNISFLDMKKKCLECSEIFIFRHLGYLLKLVIISNSEKKINQHFSSYIC